MEPTEGLKGAARDLSFDLVGVCDAHPAPHLAEYETWLGKGYQGTMDYLLRQVPLKADPSQLLPGVKSVVAVGLNYHQPNPMEPGQPRFASYALGRDYHRVLRGRLKKLTSWISESYPDASTRACVDSAPIFERDFANLAGLGWFGKNTMLINSERGSWFFIGLLLTSVHFEPDQPAVGGCGTCHACIEACPTGAIVFEEDRWQVDARNCISYLTIEHSGDIDLDLQLKIGGWTFGCDVCQDVCPFNTERSSQPLRSQLTSVEDFRKRQWPSLPELADLGEAEWDELTQGSAIRRTGLEGIRRNARINLANPSGD